MNKINLKKVKKEVRPYRYTPPEEAYVTNINSALIHESEIITNEAIVLVQKFSSGLIVQYWYYPKDGYCECILNKPYRVIRVLDNIEKVYLRVEDTDKKYTLPEPFGKIKRYVINGKPIPGYEEITNICR